MKTTTQQVAAYARLVGFCNTLSPVYNPSNASVKIAALNAMLTQAQGSIDAAISLRNTYEDAVKARRQIFAQLQPLATRIVGALRSCGASDETLAYARNIKRTICQSATSKNTLPDNSTDSASEETGNQGTSHSTSQRSYEVIATNFARLIERLSTEKLYKPNEADLQIVSLKNFLKAMRDANANVISSIIAMKNGRASQKTLFYGKAGLHGTAMGTKDYIKSVFGTMSDQYSAVKSLRFSNK